jgi:hypothetical protein
MEHAQTKIPFLPSGLTVLRIAKYAAKLGIFAFVPGLHQIACNRRILGSMLFVLFVVSEFVQLNSPREIMYTDHAPIYLFWKLSETAVIVSWLLLAFDIKKLEHRHLKPGFLLLLICVALLKYEPFHGGRTLFVHIEQENSICPAFCKFDIVEWEFHDLDVDKISVGDYVVLGGYEGPFFTTQILEAPTREVCATGGPKSRRQLLYDRFCNIFKIRSGIKVSLYDYFIPGIAGTEYRSIRGADIAMINRVDASGLRPKKIGNIREYFAFSDGISQLVGTVLFIIYKWTGINLFGLS